MRAIAILLAIVLGLTAAMWVMQRHDARPAPAAHPTKPVRPPAAPERRPTRPEPIPPTEEPAPPAITGRIGEIPDDLLARHLTIPVQGVSSADLRPSFFDVRGLHMHEALDIMAPRGQPVVAVEDGTVAKLFTSVPGGLTIYQFDSTETYAYYYAHLDRYADGLAQGSKVTRGQIIAYVGSTGDADPAHPHLHFSIFRLGPEKQWWKGEALDPYPALTGR